MIPWICKKFAGCFESDPIEARLLAGGALMSATTFPFNARAAPNKSRQAIDRVHNLHPSALNCRGAHRCYISCDGHLLLRGTPRSLNVPALGRSPPGLSFFVHSSVDVTRSFVALPAPFSSVVLSGGLTSTAPAAPKLYRSVKVARVRLTRSILGPLRFT